MKKILWIMCLLVQFSVMQATWIIVKIDNQSDLTFVQAARGDKDVEIQSISQILQASLTNPKIINLSPDAFFGSVGGCKIIAQTPQGKQATISFFGDVRHKVANGRARYADLDSRNAATGLKSSMMARVFMTQEGGVARLIGFTGYEQENQQFSLTLTGSDGSYQTVLNLA